MKDFHVLYDSLNKAQKEAVDAIEGPIMVIAGPGTGKTQILAMRILNILKTTDTKPEEILCLTYTESGAAAMRKRLSEFMGADAARVNIYTFHGLCNRIILENPETFALRGGDSERQRVMDDLEKLDLMDALIRRIPSDSPIKNYNEDPTSLRWQLGKLFDLMQEENYTPADLATMVAEMSDEERFAEAYPEFVYKKTTKFGEAGSIKRNAYDEHLRDWNKLLSASELFVHYQNLKRDAGVYEFRDMIHWVLDALKDNADFLAGYQERFQFLLVDEFQDTSGVQNEIVQLLISYWGDNPNCFVVGDDDQSIYAFQGARVSNMLAFAKRYESRLKTIVLTDNYRSTQSILDAAGKVIHNNKQRLIYQLPELSKELVAAGENRQYDAKQVQVLNYQNRFHEAIGIAEAIERIHTTGTALNEISVIYSKHAVAEELVSVLRQKSLPFMLSRSVNILEEPLIIKLCNWIEYLAMELELPHKGEYLLYELLHYDLYDIEPFEIAKISTEIYKTKGLKWREYLASYVSDSKQGDLFSADKRTALKVLWNEVETWLKKAASLNVPELVHQIIAGGGFLAMAMKDQEREWHLELLHTFLNFTITYNARRPFLTLQELVQDLSKMRRNGLSIPLEKRIGSRDGIVLTTAHGSKGLEYDVVMIIGAETPQWESDRANAMPFKINKLFEGFAAHPDPNKNEDNAEERRRLFYVALTRAKKELYISYTNQKIDAKSSDLQPSKFLLEITDGEKIDTLSIPKEDLINIEARLLREFSEPVLEVKDSNWLHKQIENFKFSPSTLYDILDCGLRFYFNRIVRIPSPPNAAMGFGLAIHDALKLLIDTYSGKAEWPESDTLISHFENAMFRYRSSFTRESFETRMQQGRDILPAYYQQRLDEFSAYKVAVTERWLECSIDGIIVGGIADKLVFNGNQVTLVDYKTGNPARTEKQFRPPTTKSIEEGKLPPKYWFQLGLYQILINHQSGKNWVASDCKIDCLQKDDDGNFPLFTQYYTSEDHQLLYQLIKEGNRKLTTLDFLTGCGRPDCEYCALAKQTSQVIELPQQAADEKM